MANNYLASVSKKVADAESLTKEEKDKLISVFPALQNAIYKTVDGWSVEKTAIDLLSGSLSSLEGNYSNVKQACWRYFLMLHLNDLGYWLVS